MESKEERGCLVALFVSLAAASVTAWYVNYKALSNAALVFFAVLVFAVILFRFFFLTKDWLTGNATFKMPWPTFLFVLIPSIVLGAYSLSHIYQCYSEQQGNGCALWLFLFILCLFGAGKFLESSDDC